MVDTTELTRFLDETLNIADIEDDSLNGLQVQGAGEVDRVALATDAAIATTIRARDEGCRMVVVHHGLFWRGRMQPVTGPLREHLGLLFDAGINLYAAHLPLDVHPTLGNNAELARMIGLSTLRPFGGYKGRSVGFVGTLEEPASIHELAGVWKTRITCEPLVLPFGPDRVRSVAIISGGGGFALPEAVEQGVDCFVTGESSHWHHHLARENGIHVVYLGHYHSETPGVRALGVELSRQFDVSVVFIDEPTMV